MRKNTLSKSYKFIPLIILTFIAALSSVCVANFTYWAKKEAELTSYTLTYDANGGSNVETVSYNVETDLLLAAAPTKQGYEFDCWKVTVSDGNWVLDTTYQAAQNLGIGYYGNVTLTAQWVGAQNTYIVNHYKEKLGVDGSVQSLNNYTLQENENLTAITNSSVTPSVKTYEGFTAPSTQTVTISADGTTVVNYYYTRNSYVVLFNQNYTSNDDTVIEQVTYEYGEATGKITDPTRTGYAFGGWFTDRDCLIAHSFSTMPAQNVTVYAKWTINKYLIQFVNYDGTVLQESTFDYGETPVFDGEEPQKPNENGYTFKFNGWNPAVVAATEDKVYTAKYTAEGITFNISVIPSQYGQITSDGNLTVNYGEDKTFTVTANQGYYVQSVIVNGVSIYQDGITATYTFTLENIIENKNISALYEVFKYNISYELDAEVVSISFSEDTTNIAYGLDVTFTVGVIDENYEITAVYVNEQEVTLNENSFTIENITENMHIRVEVNKIQKPLNPIVIIVIAAVAGGGLAAAAITTIAIKTTKRKRKRNATIQKLIDKIK